MFKRTLAIVTALFIHALTADAQKILWQIGNPDRNNQEFALAPNRYSEFREDGFFVVGRSDPKKDWPYVHPGPDDAWAGGRPHAFTILFGIKTGPASGQAKLALHFVDTHSKSPPKLEVKINRLKFEKAMPAGGGDASVFGQVAKGKPVQWEISFPANALQAGANEIVISTTTGSWVLYDAITLETPDDVELTQTSGTVVHKIHSPPVLVEHDGRLAQIVETSIRHYGDETPARVLVNGKTVTNLVLSSGTHSIQAAVEAVSKKSTIQVTVEAGGKTLAEQFVTLKPVRHWVVYLLPHSHVDIGYTHVQTDVEKAQWKYLETAIETASRTAGYPSGCRFKWNTEVLWAVDSYLRQATPEKRQAFFEAVKAGQVGLDALYGNMLTGLCRPEELLRMLSLATQLSRETGVPIVSAMITDVPGYTWGMVPALSHSGVKYFSIGPNGGDRIGHTIAAWGDKPFWWIGPNGRDRILVWMTGTGYYQVFRSTSRLLQYLQRLEEKGYPYDFVQVRHCLGDNGAPDVEFADKVKAWNDTYAYPKLVIATTAEMFRDFEKKYGSRIPEARGDFTPYWEDGAASSARETALNRAAAERLVQAETLFALFNPKAYPADAFRQAWRNVVLYDEHTWGAHNSISQPDHPFVKSQWAIKQAFALDADAQSRKLLETADSLRGQPATSPDAAQAIDVINTSAFSISSGLVVVPPTLSSEGDVVVAVSSNQKRIPSQRLSSGELVFRTSLAGTSAQRFHILKGTPVFPTDVQVKAEGLALYSISPSRHKGISLRVDETTGAIVSLQMAGRELVDAESGGLNEYIYLPGSDLNKAQRASQAKISIKERGPLVASLLIESQAPGCRKLSTEIRLHAQRNYVEIINTVDKLPIRDKEGVHFGFAFNLPESVIRMDVPWGVVRPETDQIPGACKNWFTVQRWVDISEKRRGVTLVTPDAPLVEVGGLTANLIGSLSDPRAWLSKLKPSSRIYSWAMNNHWHTNYRAEQEGPTVFRYFIFPHDGDFDPVQATRTAIECSQPLVVLPARGEPNPQPRFTISASAPVALTACKPSEDGKAIILRLFGVSGKPTKAKFNWSEPKPSRLWLSDNSELPFAPVSGAIAVPAWTIVTVRAEF